MAICLLDTARCRSQAFTPYGFALSDGVWPNNCRRMPGPGWQTSLLLPGEFTKRVAERLLVITVFGGAVSSRAARVLDDQ